MKQLKQFLLVISCVFLLPVMQGGWHVPAAAHQTTVQTVNSHHQPLLIENNIRQHFSYRTRALNDFHEHLLFVASIRIKSLFVYIHPCYKGYSQSYISVAVTLSDWRGPPAIA